MVKVNELTPGMKVKLGTVSATYVASAKPHPLYPSLWMVIWKFGAIDAWSHDALSPYQDVGELIDETDEVRFQNVRRALLHGSQW